MEFRLGAPAAPHDASLQAESVIDALLERVREEHVAEVRQLRQQLASLRGLVELGRSQPSSPGAAQPDGGECASSPGDRGASPRMQFEEVPPDQPPTLDDCSDVGAQAEAQGALQSTASSPRLSRRSSGLKQLPTDSLTPGVGELEGVGACRSFLLKMVHHPAFEIVFAILISLNGLLIGAEAQYHSFDLAKSVGIPGASSSSDTWPGAMDIFDVFQWIFGVLFTIEIAIKIIALRSDFLRDCWNWIDATIVVLFLYGRLAMISSTNMAAMPINTQILRLGRLARLVRLVRLIKVIQSQEFDSLFLMTTALRGSLSILAWSALVLFVIHLILALIMNQILREFYFAGASPNDAAEGEAAEQLYLYYGSWSRALLTMFEITLANWPTACRLLVEHVNEWFIVYALVHKMVFGVAIIGIVNGVFFQETFKVASHDDTAMVRAARRRKQIQEEKMRLLFETADEDGSGALDLEEWRKVCDDDWVETWLAAQDLKVSDAALLFNMLDDGDGRLTVTELVEGAARLRGGGSGLDQKLLLEEIRGGMQRLLGAFE